MKITKRTRSQAALLCQIAASNPWDSAGNYCLTAYDLQGESEAIDLAYAAWDYVSSRYPAYYGAECEAEAEALLRCGWSG